MYPTTEARWFRGGTLPEAMVRWFGVDRPEPMRVDRYLVPVSGPGLGVKVREGAALELKSLRAELGERAFTDRATGRLERWAKWQVSIASAPTEASGDDEWVAVEKARRLRRFTIEAGSTEPHAAREVASGLPLDVGCDAELTGLRVPGGAFWTIGFEAFGPDDAQEGVLMAAARHLLSDLPAGVTLHIGDSLSYPAWIGRWDHLGKPDTG
jgi:hypothetical protein